MRRERFFLCLRGGLENVDETPTLQNMSSNTKFGNSRSDLTNGGGAAPPGMHLLKTEEGYYASHVSGHPYWTKVLPSTTS